MTLENSYIILVQSVEVVHFKSKNKKKKQTNKTITNLITNN